MNDFYSWGLYVGTVARIRVRLHWMLLAWWAFNLHSVLQNPYLEHLARGTVLGLWALGTGLVFLHIFLHELGHCFAARAVGGDATDILLWPLGGLAFCSAPNLPRQQFIVAAGGPAVSLCLAGLAYGGYLMGDHYWPDLKYDNIWYKYSRLYLVRWSVIILVFNLVPLYPLDGGRMFHAGLWGFLARRRGYGWESYRLAVTATVFASRLTVVAGLCYALYDHSLFLAIIFLWAWQGVEQFRQRVEAGEGPDGAYGHDFSRGYTSVERGREGRRPGRIRRWLERLRRRRGDERGRDARPPRDDLDTADATRVDELLAKISRDGMGSLTDEEREFLEAYSKRRRKE